MLLNVVNSLDCKNKCRGGEGNSLHLVSDPNPSYAHDHMVLLEIKESFYVCLGSKFNDVCFDRKVGNSIQEWVSILHFLWNLIY